MKKAFKKPFTAPRVTKQVEQNLDGTESTSATDRNGETHGTPDSSVEGERITGVPPGNPDESTKTTLPRVTPAQVIEDKLQNAKEESTPTKRQKKKAMPITTMTDEAYEELFAAVLKRIHAQDDDIKSEVCDDFDAVANAMVGDCPQTQETNRKPCTIANPMKSNQTEPATKPGFLKPVMPLKTESRPKKPKKIGSHDSIPAEKTTHKTSGEQKDSFGSSTMPTPKRIIQEGTWVQCSHQYCSKWRFLADLHDPARLSDDWVCDMNTDDRYDECCKPEEAWDAEAQDKGFLFIRYTEGSLVWAKMARYPWWPAVVESDPDSGDYYECEKDEKTASHYHVVFLDDKASRLWLSDGNILPFNREVSIKSKTTAAERQRCKTAVRRARDMAMDAMATSLQERLDRYGFLKRYKGHQGDKKKQPVKDKKSKNPAETVVDAVEFPDLDLDVNEMGDVMGEADALLRSTEAILDEYFSGQSQDLHGEDDAIDPDPHNPKKIRKPKFVEDRKTSQGEMQNLKKKPGKGAKRKKEQASVLENDGKSHKRPRQLNSGQEAVPSATQSEESSWQAENPTLALTQDPTTEGSATEDLPEVEAQMDMKADTHDKDNVDKEGARHPHSTNQGRTILGCVMKQDVNTTKASDVHPSSSQEVQKRPRTGFSAPKTKKNKITKSKENKGDEVETFCQSNHETKPPPLIDLLEKEMKQELDVDDDLDLDSCAKAEIGGEDPFLSQEVSKLGLRMNAGETQDSEPFEE